MITIYSLIGLLISFIIVRFYQVRMRDKMDIRIERMEKNNLRELNKHKLNFSLISPMSLRLLYLSLWLYSKIYQSDETIQLPVKK